MGLGALRRHSRWDGPPPEPVPGLISVEEHERALRELTDGYEQQLESQRKQIEALQKQVKAAGGGEGEEGETTEPAEPPETGDDKPTTPPEAPSEPAAEPEPESKPEGKKRRW